MGRMRRDILDSKVVQVRIRAGWTNGFESFHFLEMFRIEALGTRNVVLVCGFHCVPKVRDLLRDVIGEDL